MISNDVRPLRRPPRAPVAGDVARGLGAFVALAGLLVGVPLVLLRFGHWPITGIPSWSQVADLPTTLISDSTVLGIFTVALWVAWAVFAASVLAEVVAQVRGRRRGALPTSSPIGRLAGHLVATVMVAFGSFASLSAATGGVGPAQASPLSAGGVARSHASRSPAAAVVVEEEPDPAAVPVAYRGVPSADVLAEASGAVGPAAAPAAPTPAPAPAAASPTPSATAATVIVVQRGDSPWGLAEEHLGDGVRWRELWEFNRTRPQPTGGTWANPDDSIQPGWTLAIPGTGVASGPVPAAGVVVPATAYSGAPAEDVTVEPGDHFWGLAEGQLTEAWGREPSDTEVASYWQATLNANAGRLRPPRDADDIYPGEQFVLPPAPADPLAPPAPPPAPTPPPSGSGTDAAGSARCASCCSRSSSSSAE